MATIDNLTLEITANSTKAVNDLNKLATALSALKNASKGISSANLNKVADAFSNIRSACSTLSMATVQRVERLADALERVGAVDASSMRSLSNSIANMSAQKKTSTTTPVAETTQKVVQDMGTSVEPLHHLMKTEQTESAFNRLTTAVSSFFKETKLGKAIVLGFKNNLSALGKTAKSIIAPILNFVKALGRIAFYRFVRSIIKAITSGVKEGIENLALYSKAMNELDSAQANKTMSELATSFLYLKNSIATAIMPIIQQVTPAIKTMINGIVSALNVLNQLVSILQGKSTYTKAKVYWVDYAEGLDKAGKKAKALHHQLAGFDELNNLTAPSGSGATTTQDPTKMFEEAFTDSKILETVNKIKEKFDDILRVVIAIGAGILAWKLAKGFASALTALGLLSKTGALGLTLGLTLMVAGFTLEGLSIADIFKNGLNFDNFGTSIGGALLASLGSFLTGSVAESILGGSLLAGFIGGIGTIVAGLGLTIAGIWDSIVNGIDWLSAILTVIGTTMTGAGIGTIIGTVVGSLTGPQGALIGAIAGLVVGAIVDIVILVIQNWDKIKEVTINTWTTIKEKTAEAWEKMKEFAVSANEKFNELVVKAIKWVAELFTEKIPYAIGFAIGKLVYWGTYAFAWVVANFPKFVEKVKEFLKNCWEKFKEWGTNLMNFAVYEVPKIATKIIVGFTTLPFKIWAKLVDVKNKFIEWKDDMIKWVKEKIPEIKDGILYVFSGDFLDDVYNIGADFIQNIWDGITSKTDWLFSNIADFFSKLFEKISKNFKQGFIEGGGTTPIPQYASGGYVTGGSGSLFVAGERGAEMVGSINGRTAVANRGEITDAIAVATYEAMSRALAENGGSVNIVVEGDGDRMFKVFQKKQREYQRTTGLAY